MEQKGKTDFGFGCMRLPVQQADQPESFPCIFKEDFRYDP